MPELYLNESQDSGQIAFSVVVPTIGRPILMLLINQLSQQVRHPDQVILGDDGASQSVITGLKTNYPWIEIVRGPGRGPASNRNVAASLGTNDWLVFLDDDVVPDYNLLDQYREHICNNSGVEVVEGRTYSDACIDFSIQEAPVNEQGGALWSCNFAIKRELFMKAGGFCEFFTTAGGEDIDLRQKLDFLAANVQFAAAASVYHPPRLRANFIKRAVKWRHGVFARYRWGASRLTIILFFAPRLARYYITTRSSPIAIGSGIAEAFLVGVLLPFWVIIDYKRWRAARDELLDFMKRSAN